jgi:hypothetical protein
MLARSALNLATLQWIRAKATELSGSNSPQAAPGAVVKAENAARRAEQAADKTEINSETAHEK